MATINKGDSSATLVRREPDQGVVANLVQAGYSETVARVVAARCGEDAPRLAEPGVDQLTSPWHLPDIDAAVSLISDAVRLGQTIGIVTDHDVDGVTSHAALVTTLTQCFGVPSNRVCRYISHRLNEGYGVSSSVTDRIIDDDRVPEVIITADCGSSDEDRIARLADVGIEVVVTDHHEIGQAEDAHGQLVETPPPSAEAVVNPARRDSQYGDHRICGAMVTWLVLCAVRQDLIGRGHLSPDTPKLGHLLDFVALGTVADCVSLADSANNRAVVRVGLDLMSARKRACWRVFKKPDESFGARDLGFGLGPRINACGRLSDAFAGVDFLMADDDATAMRVYQDLDELNNQRKEIGKELAEDAMVEAEALVAGGDKALAIYLHNGHPGIHGIVASRVLERYGRPVICLSPHARDDGLITGSARSPAHVSIIDVLADMDRGQPDLFVAFGGHTAAGGLTIETDRLDDFRVGLRHATSNLDEATLAPVLYTDGMLSPDALGMGLVHDLTRIEPWGQGFADAVFETDAVIEYVRMVGEDKNHAQLRVRCGDAGTFRGIWFFAVDAYGRTPVRAGDAVRLAYTPTINDFHGGMQLQVVGTCN